MKKIIINVLRVFSKLIKLDNRLVTFIFRGYSGSNISPILEKLDKKKNKNYKIKVINDGKNYRDYNKDKISKFEFYKKVIEKYFYVMRSKLVVTTHGFHRLRNDNIMINLWHGIPLKSMSLMNKSKSDDVNIVKDDYFLSTSEFFNTIMNACLGIRQEKYFIAGYPRNDYLFNQNGISNLEFLIEKKVNEKVILYMPTYRSSVLNNTTKKKKGENIFGFEEFDINSFNEFLNKNNILFLLKLHPNEEKKFENQYSNLSDNIKLIRSSNLENKEMDLYKIINSTNLLITDYSSIYFDYLLLDRPIIFTPVDYNEYKSKRGFLLEPYDYWTPGPKCLEQNSLQNEILNFLNKPNYYHEERKMIKNIVHKYQDENSTDRIISFIEDIMD